MFVRSCVINEFDLDHDLLRNFIDYEKDTKDIDFAIRLDMAHHFSSYLRIPEFMRHFNEESDYSNYAKVNVDSHAKIRIFHQKIPLNYFFLIQETLLLKEKQFLKIEQKNPQSKNTGFTKLSDFHFLWETPKS